MTADPGKRLLWDPGSGEFAPMTENPDACVVDSWLVQDGRGRAVRRHANRFASACASAFALPVEQTRAFAGAAAGRIPSAGRWFPRIELAIAGGRPQWRLWLRPAPPRMEEVRMWADPLPDSRRQPDVKGADLDLLAVRRAAARDAGADEALLVSADGTVREGASTSVLWWRGDVLCGPPPTSRILGGITRDLLLEAVAASSNRVAFEDLAPAELDGLEVWAVNALHGIRPVTRWVNVPITAGRAHRAQRWNGYLDHLAVTPSAGWDTGPPARPASACPA